MRNLVLVALLAAGFAGHAMSSSAADLLVDEKRMVGQSDSHEECAAKLTRSVAFKMMLARGRNQTHPDEDGRIVVVAKHRAISVIIEFRNPDTRVWSRIVGSCEDETYVERAYSVDGPTRFAPAAAKMRQIRTHVMDSFGSQDACIADLLSISDLTLRTTDFQEEGEGDKGVEMRLMLSGGAISTESRGQDDTGTWSTTTTTCVDGREMAVSRTSAQEAKTKPSSARTKK